MNKQALRTLITVSCLAMTAGACGSLETEQITTAPAELLAATDSTTVAATEPAALDQALSLAPYEFVHIATLVDEFETRVVMAYGAVDPTTGDNFLYMTQGGSPPPDDVSGATSDVILGEAVVDGVSYGWLPMGMLEDSSGWFSNGPAEDRERFDPLGPFQVFDDLLTKVSESTEVNLLDDGGFEAELDRATMDTLGESILNLTDQSQAVVVVTPNEQGYVASISITFADQYAADVEIFLEASAYGAPFIAPDLSMATQPPDFAQPETPVFDARSADVVVRAEFYDENQTSLSLQANGTLIWFDQRFGTMSWQLSEQGFADYVSRLLDDPLVSQGPDRDDSVASLFVADEQFFVDFDLDPGTWDDETRRSRSDLMNALVDPSWLDDDLVSGPDLWAGND